jgi:tetratricopeptide (TPR) repeat protein
VIHTGLEEDSMSTNRYRIGAAACLGLLILALPVHAEWNAGVKAFQARDYSTAVKEFQEVVDQSPNHAGSHYMLGISLRGAGQIPKALSSLQKAVELDSANPAYAIALGQTLVQAGNEAEAYTVLKKVNYSSLDANGKASYAPAFATAAIRTNRAGEAISVLEAQTKVSSRDSGLFYSLGFAYNAEGNSTKAFNAFKRAYELNPEDRKSASAAVKSAISAGRRTSSASQKSSYYSQGAQIAENLANSTGAFDDLLLAGEAWLGAKSYQKALTWFDKARSKQPQNVLVRYYRCQSLTSLNQLGDALNECQEALKIGASDSSLRTKLYNQMGFIHDKRREYDQAIAAYQNASNNRMVAEMRDKKEAAAANAEADRLKAEYEGKLRALELQIQELEAIGEMEEAAELRKHLETLRNQ